MTSTHTLGQPSTSAQFEIPIDPKDPDGTYFPIVIIQDLAGHQTKVRLPTQFIIDNNQDLLTIDQDKVSFIRSPFGNSNAEALSDSAGFTIPAGPFYEIGPADGLQNIETFPSRTFQFTNGNVLSQIRVWAAKDKSQLLGNS